MQTKFQSILPKTLLVLVGTLLGASQALALSPPWIGFQNEAKATLGADSCVHVDDLDPTSPSSYNLDVHVFCDNDKARDLAKFADRTINFGGTTVTVRVIDGSHHVVTATPVSTDPHRAAEELANALSTNFFFIQILPGRFVSDFFAEFCQGVVQFENDDISDFYKNTNVVARDAFDTVLELSLNTPVRIGEATSETILCGGSGSGK